MVAGVVLQTDLRCDLSEVKKGVMANGHTDVISKSAAAHDEGLSLGLCHSVSGAGSL